MWQQLVIVSKLKFFLCATSSVMKHDRWILLTKIETVNKRHTIYIQLMLLNEWWVKQLNDVNILMLYVSCSSYKLFSDTSISFNLDFLCTTARNSKQWNLIVDKIDFIFIFSKSQNHLKWLVQQRDLSSLE